MHGFFSLCIDEVHRTFTHSVFFPLIFLILTFVFWKTKWAWLAKHKMKLKNVFLIITFGVIVHLLLDYSLCGFIMPFYPFSTWHIGLNLLGSALEGSLITGLDAILLSAWLIHEELEHRISRFF